MNKQEVYEFLDRKKFEYTAVEHPAAFTVDEMKVLDLPFPEAGTKNLFLRDPKKNYYLLTMKEDKRADIKAFQEAIGAKHLRFGSEEELMEVLGLIKGSVTLFGILNDADCRTKVFIDSEFRGGMISAHPNENNASVYLKTEDLVDILRERGSQVEFVEV